MKLRGPGLWFLCILCAVSANASSLDREAFTFTKYDLDVRVEPAIQRLGVRGTITLRNDSQTPQKIAILQISSSLSWRSIKAGGKQLQFVSQPYSSDIDHTGTLSEAIVTLPEAVAPKSTVDLEIAYEGVVVLDATRLTQMGAPESTANSTDWDQISAKFTALRGAGFVAWYPMATDAADLSEGENLFEVLGRWKAREATSKMHIHVNVSRDDGERPPELVVNEASCAVMYEAMGRAQMYSADCTYQPLGLAVPTFAMARYEMVDRTAIRVHYLSGHNVSATGYADTADKVVPLITEWFGGQRYKAQTADLGDPNAAPFESGSLLLTPLTSDSKIAGLMVAHQLTHGAFFSPRPWINEGLAHFAQVLYLEHQSGRKSALDYMESHRSALNAAEKQKPETAPRSEDEVSRSSINRSLITTYDEELYRSKAMCVWWMLRDLVGEPALKKSLAAYRAEEDKEPSYMQRLIQAQTHRDLEWFFDDWVYRDRGLPDFKVASAFTRKLLPEGYLLTITVDNAGGAGAEIPLTVKFTGGEITKRLLVRGRSNGVIRVEIPQAPEEIVVNDGSVPESDMTNNVFKVEPDAEK